MGTPHAEEQASRLRWARERNSQIRRGSPRCHCGSTYEAFILYVEEWAPFVKELAVIVSRGRNACICSFPVVETTHKDSICHTVVSPAQVAPDIAEAAMQVAERAVGSLSGAGIFGVELFLLEDGKVL